MYLVISDGCVVADFNVVTAIYVLAIKSTVVTVSGNYPTASMNEAVLDRKVYCCVIFAVNLYAISGVKVGNYLVSHCSYFSVFNKIFFKQD